MGPVANPSLISVVDDDDSVRESLDGLLRSIGFTVKTFASAEEFLKSNHLRETGCLILDVRMPGMNGIELHRHLIANNFGMPVIFITAHGSDMEVRARALNNGALAYLDKPLSEEAVLNAVHKALNLK
jgi:FixJ family two-component response regulator